jgi:hypothetical protein
MPRVSASSWAEVSVLRKNSEADDKPWAEEAVSAVRGIGVQDAAGGRSGSRAKEDPEDHGVRGVREAGVGFRRKFQAEGQIFIPQFGRTRL